MILIHNIKEIVILTGAGISQESGIETFRDKDGLWENHRIEDVATYDAYSTNPDRVHSFYNQRRSQLLGDHIRPNLAHEALAKLEKSWQGQVWVITQNIDNLHERAGSENVLHMHGELFKARCEHCKKVFDVLSDMSAKQKCRGCHRAGCLRPDIVWFGEMPKHMPQIEILLAKADLFLAIGTSSQVYPAAMFVKMANSAHKVEINLCTTAMSGQFDETIQGKASITVPDYIEKNLTN